jgi:hypothetical protein
MKTLIIYQTDFSKGTSNELAAANVFYMKFPDAVLKDLNGLSGANVTTYIGTLTDDSYDNIIITVPVNAGAIAAGVMVDLQVALLIPKIKASVKADWVTVRAGTCQNNAVATNIILDAGASAVLDYYKGMYIVTTGVTPYSSYVTAYSGATVTATVTTTGTAITTTETFVIYQKLADSTGANGIIATGNTVTATGKTAVVQAWEACWPDAGYPLWIHYMGGYKSFMCSGTAQAAAAGTITLATTASAGDVNDTAAHTTNDAYNGMTVYLYSADALKYCQKATILSYVGATQVATLTANWGVTPTGTILYRVVQHDDLSVYFDRAMEIYVATKWQNPALTATLIDVPKWCSKYGKAELDNLSGSESPTNDMEYINLMINQGKFAFLADALGII